MGYPRVWASLQTPSRISAFVDELVRKHPANKAQNHYSLEKGYVGTGRNAPSSEAAKRCDHGGSLSKPEPKRQRSGSIDDRKPSPNQQSTPVHESRCCNCTKSLTCQTKRSECVKAQRPCTSCNCSVKCVEFESQMRVYQHPC
jgi:hypothetical protein